MSDFFNFRSRTYERRAETMLREARFLQLEHDAAAERHDALARYVCRPRVAPGRGSSL